MDDRMPSNNTYVEAMCCVRVNLGTYVRVDSSKQVQGGGFLSMFGLALLLVGCGTKSHLNQSNNLDAGATIADQINPDFSSDDSIGRSVHSDNWICPTQLCDPSLNADAGVAECPDAGICQLGSMLQCLSSVGARRAGESCAKSEECASQHACFKVNGAGMCGRVCCPDLTDNVCASEEICAGSGLLVDGEQSEWGRCLMARPCDLSSPICDEGEGCYLITTSPAGAQCERAGTTLLGSLCQVQNDCLPGLACLGVGERRCAQICTLNVAASCLGSERCQAYSYTPSGIGICTP